MKGGKESRGRRRLGSLVGRGRIGEECQKKNPFAFPEGRHGLQQQVCLLFFWRSGGLNEVQKGKSASEIVKTLCRPPTLLDPPTQPPSHVSETRAWTTYYYYYMRRIHKTKAISIEASHKICSKGNDTPSTKVQYLYDSRVLQKTKTPPTYTSYSPYKKKPTTLTHPIHPAPIHIPPH